MAALHPGEMARLLEQEIDRYLDPTLDERISEARWKLQRQLSEIEDEIVQLHQEEIDQLTSDYEAVNDAFNALEESAEAWEENAEHLWATMEEELGEKKPGLPVPPTARPANEPDGFVLFDSKRDYLTQIDAYREWQRR